MTLVAPVSLTGMRNVWFVGAGISRNVPTGFPTAPAIVDGILQVLATDPATLRELRELADWSRPTKRSPGDYIRFEQLLEAVHSLADPDLAILDFVDLYTVFNPLHLLLAQRALAGDLVITTNFDCLIEDAVISLGGEPVSVCRLDEFRDWESLLDSGRTPIFKIHGSYWRYDGSAARPTAIETVQATLDTVVAGGAVMRLPEPKRSFLLECIRGRRLILAGYSGSDDLDIMPTFQEIAPAEAVWIDHGPGEEDVSDLVRDRVLRAAPLELGIRERFFRRMFESRVGLLRIVRAETAPFLHELAGIRLRTPSMGGSDPGVLEKFLRHWSEDHLQPSYRRDLVISGVLRMLARAGKAIDHLLAAEAGCACCQSSVDDHVKICRLLSDAYASLTRYPEAEAWARKAESLLPLGETSLRAMVIHQRGVAEYNLGRPDSALRFFEEAEMIARRTGGWVTAADALHDRAIIVQDRADYTEASRLYQESIRFAGEAGQIRHVAFTFHQLGTLFYDQADFPEAREHFERALTLAATLGDQAVVADALHGLGLMRFLEGELAQALRHFRQSSRIEELLGRTAYLPISWQHIGICFLEDGRLDRAETYLLRARDGYRAVGDLINLSELLSYLAQLSLEKRDLKAAGIAAGEAEELAREAGIEVNEIRARHILGVIDAHSNRAPATEKVRQALLDAEQLGAKTLILDLAYLSGRAGVSPGAISRIASLLGWVEETYIGLGNKRRAAAVAGLL